MKQLLLLFLLLPTPFTIRAAANEVVFAYSDLGPTDWTLSVAQLGNGGTVTATSQSAGRNPGAYLRIVNQVNSAPDPDHVSALVGFFELTGATYDPSTQGSITSIIYAEDGIMWNGFGQGQVSRPFLVQDGVIYVEAAWCYVA